MKDVVPVLAEFLDHLPSLSPELTRPNRGRRLWLPRQLHGVAAFREALDHKLDLAHTSVRIAGAAKLLLPELASTRSHGITAIRATLVT